MIMINSSNYSQETDKNLIKGDNHRHMTTSFGSLAKNKEEYFKHRDEKLKSNVYNLWSPIERLAKIAKKKEKEKKQNKGLNNTDYTCKVN